MKTKILIALAIAGGTFVTACNQDPVNSGEAMEAPDAVKNYPGADRDNQKDTTASARTDGTAYDTVARQNDTTLGHDIPVAKDTSYTE